MFKEHVGSPKFEDINDEKSFFRVFVSILSAIALGSMIMKDKFKSPLFTDELK